MGTLAIISLIGKILSVIGGFAVLATGTPNSSRNNVLDFLLRLINAGGFNFGKASNRS